MFRFAGLLIAGILFFTGVAYAAGTTSAAFLKLGIGARNAAMGETGAAGNGAYAAYWNPAALELVKAREVSFMHAAWLNGIRFQNVSYAQKISQGAVGAAATCLSVPAMEKYDNTGLAQNTTYTPSDIALMLSYGRTFGRIPLGLNIKTITSTIDDKTARGAAIDIGMMFIPGEDGFFKGLRLGAALQNMGAPMKFESESFPLPFNIKAGGWWNASENIDFALDINKAVDTDVIANAGAQYTHRFSPAGALQGRLGYKSGVQTPEGISGASAGVGFSCQAVSVDYAFVPYGGIDVTQRLSLQLNF